MYNFIVSDTMAYPLANLIRTAFSLEKRGVVALGTDSTIFIPGVNLSPHELMGHLVNLSFNFGKEDLGIQGFKAISIELTSSHHTLGDISRLIGLEVITSDGVDLETPILSVTEVVSCMLIVGTYTATAVITGEDVYEYAVANTFNPDTMIVSELPMHQERLFPYTVEKLEGGLSGVKFNSVDELEVDKLLKGLSEIKKI